MQSRQDGDGIDVADGRIVEVGEYEERKKILRFERSHVPVDSALIIGNYSNEMFDGRLFKLHGFWHDLETLATGTQELSRWPKWDW